MDFEVRAFPNKAGASIWRVRFCAVQCELGEDIVIEATQLAAKTARLEARLTDRQKALFQHAADLTGRSLTEFVVSSAQEVAARTVREHEVLTLNGLDRQVFVDALLKPISPNKRLRQAARRYKSVSGL
jgi:uncharacterized protein (DUF1778 family)